MCERDIYPTIGLAALNTGGPVGVYLFGVLNDRVGRRISYFTCLTTLLAGSFLTVMSVNFWMWAVSRMIVGLTIPAVYQIPFIIGMLFMMPNWVVSYLFSLYIYSYILRIQKMKRWSWLAQTTGLL